MTIEGYYYLHTNGSLIYKRELGETAADLRESDFVRAFWPVDTSDRESAWRLLIEARAFNADANRIAELAEKWGCDDEDALMYAERIGVRLFEDGDQKCATRLDFVNAQESPIGFGPTYLQAMVMLAHELSLKPSKMWGASFHDLVAGAAA